MKLNKAHWIGIIFSLVIFIVDVIFFRQDNLFFFLIGIAIVILAMPFVGSIIIENNMQKEKNERFLEFSRNLAESVKSGTPIGQSIMNMRTKKRVLP